jgi:hypothetical protein
VGATSDTPAIHCPRCRALQNQIQLAPLEESLEHLSAPLEQHPERSR